MPKLNWEQKFDETFINHGEFIYKKGSYPATCNDIKVFIRSIPEIDVIEFLEKLKEQYNFHQDEKHCTCLSAAIEALKNKLKGGDAK